MTVRRQRVTIASVPLVVRPDPAALATFDAARRGELITPMPVPPIDLREGRRTFEVVVEGWRFEAVVEPAGRAELRERGRHAAADHQSTAAATLRAQIPGRVVRLWVSDGEQVEQGQRLLAIEAMKMENEIRAPQAGVVSAIRVEMGARIERDDELLTVG